MKNFVLILTLMLAACASDIRWGNSPETAAAAKESRKSDTKSPPAPAKAQPPEHKEELPLPKKREHNIEED